MKGVTNLVSRFNGTIDSGSRFSCLEDLLYSMSPADVVCTLVSLTCGCWSWMLRMWPYFVTLPDLFEFLIDSSSCGFCRFIRSTIPDVPPEQHYWSRLVTNHTIHSRLTTGYSASRTCLKFPALELSSATGPVVFLPSSSRLGSPSSRCSHVWSLSHVFVSCYTWIRMWAQSNKNQCSTWHRYDS